MDDSLNHMVLLCCWGCAKLAANWVPGPVRVLLSGLIEPDVPRPQAVRVLLNVLGSRPLPVHTVAISSLVHIDRDETQRLLSASVPPRS